MPFCLAASINPREVMVHANLAEIKMNNGYLHLSVMPLLRETGLATSDIK